MYKRGYQIYVSFGNILIACKQTFCLYNFIVAAINYLICHANKLVYIKQYFFMDLCTYMARMAFNASAVRCCDLIFSQML